VGQFTMEIQEGTLDERNPDSTINERSAGIVDYDGGGVERGGSHRSWLWGGRWGYR
jgi:hypothetical protein